MRVRLKVNGREQAYKVGGVIASADRRLLDGAARMGIGDRVIFLPFSDRPEELHAMADALIFPSYYDTFGSVPLEAMASGLPVVVSARAGMSELITDGEDGMILKDPDDVDGMVTALSHIMDDSLRERMGRKARETAERQTWDQVTDRTLRVYQEIVGSR